MQSHDRIRHSVLIDLLRRARAHLPTGPVDQKQLDEQGSIKKDQLLLAVDIDTVFEALWNKDLLPGSDRPSVKHPVNSSCHGEQIL